MSHDQEPRNRDIVLTIGHEELTIRQRYETLSIVNDILIAVWFVLGSALFFSESTTVAGTWLFLLGSVELLVRPGIRLLRQLHLRRLSPECGAHPGSVQDF